MIHWMGAFLIVAACSAAGWQGRWELHRRVRSYEEAEKILEHIRIHICDKRQPLPELLPGLQSGYPRRFSGVVQCYERAKDIPFGEYWNACVKASGLCREAGDHLCELVDVICRGQAPERAVDQCLARLERERRAAEASEREKGKIYMAFGTAGGCFLALILL